MPAVVQRALLAALTSLAFSLAGCGGGGSSDARSAAPTASVNSVAPDVAAPGGEVIVNGSGMRQVTSVSVDGRSAQFTVLSDTQLSAIVPQEVASSSATVTVAGNGFSTQAPALLSVMVPTLTAITRTDAPVGTTVSVSGTRLDQVKRFAVADIALVATDVTTTHATLRLPDVAVDGALVLTDLAGVARDSGYRVGAYVPAAVVALSRLAVAEGDTVTAYGIGLDAVQAVTLADGTTGTVQARSAGQLIFTTPRLRMPGVPQRGIVTFVTPHERITTAVALTVGPAVGTARTVAVTDGATTTLTITGTNLQLVDGATIGGADAALAAATPTRLTLTTPGRAAGAVVLRTPYQQNVAAGTVTDAGPVAATLSELDFAQVLDKPASDTTLRLTPQRPVLARAFVTANAPGVTNPGVSLVVSNGSSTLGTLAMTGPATLPTTADADHIDTTYNVTVPAAWIRPGVKFKAMLAGAEASTAQRFVEAAPTVGRAAKLRIVLVPLSIGGVVARLPSESQVREVFARVYPMASDSIVVTRRATFVASGVSMVDTTADANVLLDQLEALRQQEEPEAFYYGMFASALSTKGLGGVGTVGTRGQERQSPAAAVGHDATYRFAHVDPFDLPMPSWAQVMLHEIGHNHSLRHAPCGNPAGLDPQYPYAGGVLNPAMPVYNSLYADDAATGTLASPVTSQGAMTDLMGYCAGIFLSDYSYARAQAYAEARTAAFAAATTGAAGARKSALHATRERTGAWLVVSGRVDANGAVFAPPRATQAGPLDDVVPASAYALRLRTADGRTFEHAVLVHEVADASEGAGRFSRAVPNPGELVQIELLQHGKVLAQAATPSSRSRALAAHAPGEARATWTESGGALRLEWNAAVEPFASITHVAGTGARHVLGVNLEGGSARVDTSQLPRGGRFELSLASGTAARIVTFSR